MAKYTSRYPELAFYVDDVERKFNGGIYDAQTEAEEAVLNRLTDAVKLEEEPEEPKKPRAKKAQTAETAETSEE